MKNNSELLAEKINLVQQALDKMAMQHDQILGNEAELAFRDLKKHLTAPLPEDRERALDWTDDALLDIDESRVKLRKSNPVLDRAEECIQTIRAALQQPSVDEATIEDLETIRKFIDGDTDTLERFLGTLEACGFKIVKQAPTPPAQHGGDDA